MNTQPENSLPETEPQHARADVATEEQSDKSSNADLQTETKAAAASAVDPSLEDLQAQLAEAEKRVLMAQADLENFRRRTRQNAQEQIKYASLDLMSEILESVDNLNRAVEAHANDPDGKGLADGVHLVAQQIANALANHGCKKIESEGQPFDPNRHQAVTVEPSNDHDPNMVLQELRAGFQLHDRVIRPAQVIVSGEV